MFMHKIHGNAIVGQSGGPTSAINATLSGVIRGVKEGVHDGLIDSLYGMRHGIEGLAREEIIDLGAYFDTEDKLALLEQTPAAFLGSCRKKLPPIGDDQSYYEHLISVFRKYNIRFFFYIGGNDSMDTVAKLSEYIRTHDYEMVVLGIPKTIDNDLTETDHTPGFGSAAKYVAVTVQEIIRDCAVYFNPAVTVVEIMGRDAGWLTAASAVGRLVNGVEPDLVYLPERTFDMQAFLTDLSAVMKRRPQAVVAVSEGIRYANGQYVADDIQSKKKDAFGHAYLAGSGRVLESAIRQAFGCKVRAAELSLPQRCAAHLASFTDIQESVCIGREAVRAAGKEITGCTMIFQRHSSDPYRISIGYVDVARVANRVRTVDDRLINTVGNHVTDECCQYILPLIAGEPKLQYEKGLPKHLIL